MRCGSTRIASSRIASPSMFHGSPVSERSRSMSPGFFALTAAIASPAVCAVMTREILLERPLELLEDRFLVVDDEQRSRPASRYPLLAGGAAGSVTLTVAPWPGALAIEIFPPCASTRVLAHDEPDAEPLLLRAVERMEEVVLQVVGIESRPRVLHRDRGPLRRRSSRRTRARRPPARRLDGVEHEILDDPVDGGVVDPGARPHAAGEFERDALRSRRLARDRRSRARRARICRRPFSRATPASCGR